MNCDVRNRPRHSHLFHMYSASFHSGKHIRTVSLSLFILFFLTKCNKASARLTSVYKILSNQHRFQVERHRHMIFNDSNSTGKHGTHKPVSFPSPLLQPVKKNKPARTRGSLSSSQKCSEKLFNPFFFSFESLLEVRSRVRLLATFSFRLEGAPHHLQRALLGEKKKKNHWAKLFLFPSF